MKAINISWDTDGECVELPTEIELPFGVVDEDEISDYISDETGFCHKGFELIVDLCTFPNDDKNYCKYFEVSKNWLMEILEDLLDRCYKVLTGSTMMLGQVKNGQQYVDGKWVDCMEPGKVIINPEVAEELLPSCGGFFFGNTSYDEWYMQDIENTIKIIKNVLATTDFKTQMLAYCSSW